MEKRWLKVKEAAEYLGINHKTLYELIAKGEIAHSRRKGKASELTSGGWTKCWKPRKSSL